MKKYFIAGIVCSMCTLLAPTAVTLAANSTTSNTPLAKKTVAAATLQKPAVTTTTDTAKQTTEKAKANVVTLPATTQWTLVGTNS